MSRYRPDPRYGDGNLAYRDPPPQRWDAERFVREREVRAPAPVAPVLERERDYPPPRRGPAYEDQRGPAYEKQRYYEEDHYGPRGSTERRYFEETDYYRDNDPRASRGQMVPYAARPEPMPRPGILRRQSSLDTFDRRPQRRFDDYYDDGQYRPRPGPPAPPTRELIPVRAPSPRRAYPRYEERERYDDVRVQDPDRYGDDGFREYREREWVRSRGRNDSHSPSRRGGSPDRHTTRGEEILEEKFKEEIIEEKPYPRRGKTRMPKRLVHTKVLFDLGYPYYEEDERTLIIEKALGPDNIDEVFTRSKEYREKEVTTTRLIEAAPTIIVPDHGAPSVRAPSVHGGEVIIEKERYEKIETVPLSEAPRSVREWDGLSVRSPSPKSHRSHSRRRSRRGSSPREEVIKETIIKKEEIIRDVSPARTHRSRAASHSHHNHRSEYSDDETIIERRVTREQEFEDSNSVHVGPLALVVDRKPPRSERDIKEEIRRLERERRGLRQERRYEREGGEVIKIERVRERSPSPRGEVIIRERGDEVLEVKKDRRARARSAAPSPGIIKAMFATLT